MEKNFRIRKRISEYEIKFQNQYEQEAPEAIKITLQSTVLQGINCNDTVPFRPKQIKTAKFVSQGLIFGVDHHYC